MLYVCTGRSTTWLLPLLVVEYSLNFLIWVSSFVHFWMWLQFRMIQHMVIYLSCELFVIMIHFPLANILITLCYEFWWILWRKLCQQKGYRHHLIIFLFCATIRCSVAFLYTVVAFATEASSSIFFFCSRSKLLCGQIWHNSCIFLWRTRYWCSFYLLH